MLRQTMFLACLLALIGSAQAALDDYYHNYDEVLSELDSLETLYPEWLHTITIGYSHVGNRPIKAVRVSDNPQVDEGNRPSSLAGTSTLRRFWGTEIVMQALEELTYHGSIMHPEWMPILTSLELWFVPCWNPDGLDVVLSETDVTYRKNTHSLAEDGHCHLEPGIGNDSCGVDLNRNWPFWWNHGDTLWSDNNDVEQFDYFRGPTPFSESESQAVRDLLLATRPVAGVQYHSARTSTNYEILIHAWDFGVGDDGIKTCPRWTIRLQQTLTRTMADQIETLDHNLYRNFAGVAARAHRTCGCMPRWLRSDDGGSWWTCQRRHAATELGPYQLHRRREPGRPLLAFPSCGWLRSQRSGALLAYHRQQRSAPQRTHRTRRSDARGLCTLLHDPWCHRHASPSAPACAIHDPCAQVWLCPAGYYSERGPQPADQPPLGS